MQQPITPNWKIALQISWYHTRTANRITGSLVGLALIVALISFKLTGHPLNLALFNQYLLPYRGLIVLTGLLIHFIPVNLYAIIKVLKHRYPGFHLLVMANPENSNETDRRYHQTL